MEVTVSARPLRHPKQACKENRVTWYFWAIYESGFTLFYKAGNGTFLQRRVWVTKTVAGVLVCPPGITSRSLHQSPQLTSAKCSLALFVSLAHLHRVQHSREEHKRAGSEQADLTGSFDLRYVYPCNTEVNPSFLGDRASSPNLNFEEPLLGILQVSCAYYSTIFLLMPPRR